MSKVVYLAERGCYEERYVSGVFDTPERAMAALHQEGWVWTRELWHFKSTSEVRHGGMESWENDQDWQDALLDSLPGVAAPLGIVTGDPQ